MRVLLLLLLWQSPSVQDLSAITRSLRENRYAEAVALTQAALALNRDDYRIWTLQGVAHAALNQQSQALTDLKHAVQLSPNYLPALKAEAQIEYQTHDPHGRDTLQKILHLEPRDQVSHAMFASISFDGRECGAAVEHYRMSESLITNQPIALTQYGQCLFKTGQKEKAIEVLRNAAALDAESWRGAYNLAVALLLSGRTKEAIAEIQPPLASPHPPSQLLDFAAGLYEEIGDTPRAVQLLRQAIIDQPSDNTLYLHFADLCFAHNSFQVGISMLNAGMQKLPGSAALLLARGILYVQLGEYEKAESDFDRAAELDPAQGFSSVAEGLTELQKSNLDSALQITRNQLSRNPDDAYLHYLMAEILRQKGSMPGTRAFAEAVASAEQAVKLDPGLSLAQDLLGTFYLRLNRFDQAMRRFEAVLAKSPNDETALYHLIVSYKKSGRGSDLTSLLKRLSDAKAANKDLEARRNRFAFVEPTSNH